MVHDSDEGLSEDEQAIDTQEEFEHKYNFRYEEPDQDFVRSFFKSYFKIYVMHYF